ncbi:hypothetical protein BN7_1079 [Wickerhamomyces ciferrii]|uniref:DUF2415 domain-containing protein n=1 Tax=Wickerhamomyces ciferrii (strain ATCC 14091 / BCRC 22168 / CBS 111 / JCM 3599 / NBRC 0793 / NRRL Y-1031 F-60-10) TaxID=1206466 RepID=K0KK79_WICCF|nr:uncharacterized protein BN7_1079 [Wickerhamomyces ciferrii]CCH41538.1 hypothetical protein BN7_1079 [Wickerhamomyces ciferrii]
MSDYVNLQPLSTDKNEILYTYNDTIRSTNRKSDKVTTVTELDYQPRCFKEIDDLIVSGGVISSVNNNNSMTNLTRSMNTFGDGDSGVGATWRGLFSVYNRATQEKKTIRLGSYINNNALIKKTSNGQYASYVCNNDMNLYNTDINSSSVTVNSYINLGFPLNHAALSDDGKNLVVVGDSSNIILLHPNEHGSSTLRDDNIINTSNDFNSSNTYDSGFSTSFDSSGLHFATCFQDGVCFIYDIRNVGDGPIKKIYSTRRHSSNGAFRCVKYSGGTDDLLLISEHVGRVHVLDTRDFNNHQVIMLPVNNNPRSRQSSVVSLSNAMSGTFNNSRAPSAANINPKVYTPKILEYNDILNYEGNLSSLNTLENTFHANYNTNYNTRNFNNYNLLSAVEDDHTNSDEAIADDIEDDCDGSTEIEDPMDEEVATISTSHRSSMGSTTTAATMATDFDYADNEISGIDWYEDNQGSHLVIGCDNGLINWDIDSWGRRSFPSVKLL